MLARQWSLLEPCSVSCRSPSVDVAPAVCETSFIRTGCKSSQRIVYRGVTRQPTAIRLQAGPGRGRPPAAVSAGELSLGIDCGTSGARSIVIDGMCYTCAALALTHNPHIPACCIVHVSSPVKEPSHNLHIVFHLCSKHMIAGNCRIVYETEASFDKLKSEDWVAPWTRYNSPSLSRVHNYPIHILWLCLNDSSERVCTFKQELICAAQTMELYAVELVQPF